jgi:hypothetical protein
MQIVKLNSPKHALKQSHRGKRLAGKRKASEALWEEIFQRLHGDECRRYYSADRSRIGCALAEIGDGAQ